MSGTKGPHHRGTYHVRSAKLRAAAYAQPATRCWRCTLTLNEIRTTHPRARWTAGHLVDGQVNGVLLPECSPCNYSHGGRRRHELARRPQRTELTW